MIELIKTFYSNKQVIKMRKLNILFTILLFILTIFLSSIPNYVGRYSTTLAEYENLYPNLATVISELSEDYDLQLVDSKMNYSKDASIEIAGYNVILNDNYSSNSNSTIHLKSDEFYISNQNGDYIRGNYSTLSDLDFKDYEDIETVSYLFLKNVDLGTFSTTMITIFIANFIQTFLYSLIVTLLLITIKKAGNLKVDYSFKEALNMVVIILFSSSFLVAMLGMFRPNIASVSLSLFFLIRFIRFYYYNFKRYFFTN